MTSITPKLTAAITTIALLAPAAGAQAATYATIHPARHFATSRSERPSALPLLGAHPASSSASAAASETTTRNTTITSLTAQEHVNNLLRDAQHARRHVAHRPRRPVRFAAPRLLARLVHRTTTA